MLSCALSSLAAVPDQHKVLLSQGHVFERDSIMATKFVAERRSTDTPVCDRICDITVVFGSQPAPPGFVKIISTLNKHSANLREVRGTAAQCRAVRHCSCYCV
jgi:hypothetical protein